MRKLIFWGLLVATSHAYAIGGFYEVYAGAGGSQISSDIKVNAGSGLGFGLGVVHPISNTKPHRFEAQAGISYIFMQNGSDEERNMITWRRVPLDALYFYRNTANHFRVGWGATYHINNHLNGDGTMSGKSFHAENALGWVITAQYAPGFVDTTNAAFGLRYVNIKYRADRFSGGVIDGSALYATLTLLRE